MELWLPIMSVVVNKSRWRVGTWASVTYLACLVSVYSIGFLFWAVLLGSDDLGSEGLLAFSVSAILALSFLALLSRVIRRNYVELDYKSSMVIVASAGEIYSAPFARSRFYIPARRSIYLPDFVKVSLDGYMVQCSLMSQGRYWNSLALRWFIKSLDVHGIEWQAI